ncbi:MAG: YitT family protein [Chloroflexi bacterium]|nr:MAG: YitT family protein [Chloroflexota bacterium]
MKIKPGNIRSYFRKEYIWQALLTFVLLTFGSTLAAFSYVVFQVPFNIVAGGLSGLSIVINHYTGWPVGLMYWVMNMPLLILGFYYLGRWRFVMRTLFAATIFATATDLFHFYLPQIMSSFPLTSDLLLSSVYGGIVGGISAGLVYRSGSTFGGTGIIGRVIQQRTGLPLSQSYFFTDGAIIVLAGVVFGWEVALYGLLVLFLSGLASDYTLEGPSSTRVAMIITDYPQEMSQALMQWLNRGVSYWPVTGGYTGSGHYLVMCTIYRPQVNDVKRIVGEVDPHAFLTIGVGHQAVGEGFGAFRPQVASLRRK